MIRVVVDTETLDGKTLGSLEAGEKSSAGAPSEPKKAGAATWIDVVLPTVDELAGLAKRFKLHRTAVQDCLEPEHMPKFERFGAVSFMIFRAVDEAALAAGATPQQLTRKIAVFAGPGFLLSIHRLDLPSMASLRSEVETLCDKSSAAGLGPATLEHLLIRKVLDTYDAPVAHLTRELDQIELATFHGGKVDDVFHSGYQLRRRASVFRHLLLQTRDILDEFGPDTPEPHGLDSAQAVPLVQDLRDKCARLHYYVDSVIDNLDSVLNLHLSLTSSRLNEASHKANEVMRLLTVYSAFFLPLNFIAGVYGMNFEHMPELKWHGGYPMTLVLMGTVAALIFVWFKKNGWLKADQDALKPASVAAHSGVDPAPPRH
jgi:magnesium transporter